MKGNLPEAWPLSYTGRPTKKIHGDCVPSGRPVDFASTPGKSHNRKLENRHGRFPRLPSIWQNIGYSSSRRCLTIMGRGRLLRFVLLFAVASVRVAASQQNLAPACCERESERLSQRQVRAQVEQTRPIQAPCCADMLRISGTVVLAITVDFEGNVTCVQAPSGHPLIIGVAIDSVRQWKFRPYVLKGVAKAFCGEVALRFRANEHSVKYKML